MTPQWLKVRRLNRQRYYQRHKDRILARQREQYRSDPEFRHKKIEQGKAWYRAKKARILRRVKP